MDAVSSAGIAGAWVAARQDGREQAVALAALKAQAASAQSLADMIAETTEAARPDPAPPPGQGTMVDRRA